MYDAADGVELVSEMITLMSRAEAHRVWRRCSDLVQPDELERAGQLVGNGLRFSLEAPGSVAALAGPQALWRTPQAPLAVLKDLEHWSAVALQEEVFCQLQPQQAYTLVALPKGEG